MSRSAPAPAQGRSRSRRQQTDRLRRAVLEVLEDRRLLSAGDLDSTFGTGGNVATDLSAGYDAAYALAVQSDGKIVAAGQSDNDFAVLRYNTDGALDTGFGTGGSVVTDFNADADWANDVLIQSDGKIVVAGTSYSSANPFEGDLAVARYNTDGSLDTSFSSDGKLTLDFGTDEYNPAVALASDGKIVVLGNRSGATEDSLIALARLNTDGSLDTGFSSDGKLTTLDMTGGGAVEDVAVQSDGKIVLAGTLNGGWGPKFMLARFESDGDLDTTFGTSGIAADQLYRGDDLFLGHAMGLSIQSDGTILVGGDSTLLDEATFDMVNGFAAARYESDGSLDTTYGSGGIAHLDIADFGMGNAWAGLAVDSQGRVAVAGDVNGVGAVARFAADGSVDTTFGTGGWTNDASGSIYGLAVQADDNVVVGGTESDGITVARREGVALTIPAAPTNLAATVASATQINLTWDDNSGNEDGFTVWISTDGGTTYTQAATLAANSTSHAISNLSPSTSYTFQVTASNAAGSSTPGSGSTTSASTVGPSPLMPTFEVGVVTTTSIAFTYSTTDGSNLQLEWKTPDDENLHTFDGAATGTGTTADPLVISGLAPDTEYTFRLRADKYGRVVYAPADVTTLAPPAPPGAPDAPSDLDREVGGVPTFGNPTYVHLTWTDNSDDEDYFQIQWKHEDPNPFAAGGWSGIHAASPDQEQFNQLLGPDEDYSFRIRAVNEFGASEWLNFDSFHTPSFWAPSAPASISAQVISSTRIDVSWTGGDSYVGVVTDLPTPLRYESYAVGSLSLTGLQPGTTYRIAAYGFTGFGPEYHSAGHTNIISATTTGVSTQPAPDAPTNLSARPIERNKIRLLWDNVPDDESGYRIERKPDSEPDEPANWDVRETVEADDTDFDDTLPGEDNPLDWVKLWDYRVVAVNDGGDSGAATTSQSGLSLQDVSFGGWTYNAQGQTVNNFQSIKRDAGTQAAYAGPQWHDVNLNEDIDTDGDPFTNGTEEGENEHTFPISFVRSRPNKASFMSAGPVLAFNGTKLDGWKLTGVGGGYEFTAEAPEDGGGLLWSSVNAKKALPDTIANETLEITWKLSTDGGQSYFDVGTSTNHMYVTGAVADGAFETVLDIGSRNAAGKRPAEAGELEPGASGASEEVVNAIWSEFADREVKDVAGNVLTYWGAGNATQAGADTASLLATKDGRCGSWADFFVNTLQAQGISAGAVGIHDTDLVRQLMLGGPNIPGDASGIAIVMRVDEDQAGQGNPNPNNDFIAWRQLQTPQGPQFVDPAAHVVVRVSGITTEVANTIFDPSYGERFDGETMGHAERLWEDSALQGWHWRYYVGAGGNTEQNDTLQPHVFDRPDDEREIFFGQP